MKDPITNLRVHLLACALPLAGCVAPWEVAAPGAGVESAVDGPSRGGDVGLPQPAGFEREDESAAELEVLVHDHTLHPVVVDYREPLVTAPVPAPFDEIRATPYRDPGPRPEPAGAGGAAPLGTEPLDWSAIREVLIVRGPGFVGAELPPEREKQFMAAVSRSLGHADLRAAGWNHPLRAPLEAWLRGGEEGGRDHLAEMLLPFASAPAGEGPDPDEDASPGGEAARAPLAVLVLDDLRAETLTFEPAVLGEEPLPEAGAYDWIRDPDDSHHYVCSSRPPMFDPESASLWGITEAFVSRQTSRAEYLRSDRAVGECCDAGTPHEHDGVWWDPVRRAPVCRICGGTSLAVFVGGYVQPGSGADPEATYLVWGWIPPRDGVYPVASPTPAMKATGYRTVAHAWDSSGAMGTETGAELALAQGGDATVAVLVRSAATLLDREDLRRFNLRFGREVDGKVLIPAAGEGGEQIYRRVELGPFREPSMAGRRVATLRLACSFFAADSCDESHEGALRLAYPDLAMSHGADPEAGADARPEAPWPAIEAQYDALFAAIFDEFAGRFLR